MQVYHESSPPEYLVTLAQWRNQTVPGPLKINTCINAARVLESMIEDLRDELERPNIAPPAVRDAASLITLVSYLYYEPLLNVLTALEGWDVPDRLSELKSDYTRGLQLLDTCLRDALLLAQRIHSRHPATESVVQRVYEFSVLQNNSSFLIPAFSPLELLLRVVTAREKWVNHEALFKAYRDLKVRQAVVDETCLPKSGFACLGMTTNGDPTCVLGFSAEYWTDYPEMHNFVRNIHDSRCHAFGGTQLVNIVKWSRELRDRYGKDETPLSLIATPPGYFTHKDDVASPFYCDTFKPRDRCTRCQALFEYKVTQFVRDLEARKNRENKNRRPNQEWSCAEVYAHFCCQQLSENGHSPCEMRQDHSG